MKIGLVLLDYICYPVPQMPINYRMLKVAAIAVVLWLNPLLSAEEPLPKDLETVTTLGCDIRLMTDPTTPKYKEWWVWVWAKFTEKERWIFQYSRRPEKEEEKAMADCVKWKKILNQEIRKQQKLYEGKDSHHGGGDSEK